MTITLELPEEVAARLQPLSESEQRRFRQSINDFALAWLRRINEDTEEDQSDSVWEPTLVRIDDLTPEDAASIQRGLADGEAGREVDGDAFFAQLRQRYSAGR